VKDGVFLHNRLCSKENITNVLFNDMRTKSVQADKCSGIDVQLPRWQHHRANANDEEKFDL